MHEYGHEYEHVHVHEYVHEHVHEHEDVHEYEHGLLYAGSAGAVRGVADEDLAGVEDASGIEGGLDALLEGDQLG